MQKNISAVLKKKKKEKIFHFPLCVYMGGLEHASTHGIQKRISDLLELQGGLVHPVRELGTQLRSSATTLPTLNN